MSIGSKDGKSVVKAFLCTAPGNTDPIRIRNTVIVTCTITSPIADWRCCSDRKLILPVRFLDVVYGGWVDPKIIQHFIFSLL